MQNNAKIHPLKKGHAPITRTSMFIQFLIRICFIPVHVKNDKIVFKMISFKTMVFFITYVGLFITAIILGSLASSNKLIEMMQQV